VTARTERAEASTVAPELDATSRVRRRAGWFGFAAVAGNLLGVAFLGKMPSAYRLARLDEWASAVRAQPASTIASALCFAGGLAALSSWALEFGQSTGTPRARKAGSLIAATALANAAGSLLPAAAALGAGHAHGLLRTSLTLDAFFNLGLGVGLLGIAADLRRPVTRRLLALAAGGASVPVAGQAVWDGAASVLYVAAPLWLTLIAVTSIDWLRSDASAGR
jgi:hypothetical protein